MKRLVFLGPPGAGKGTQAKLYCETEGLAHISTGAMLRQAVEKADQLGERVKSVIEGGRLVPDDLMVEIITERIQADDCSAGYVLDGFPRTIPQAEALQEMLTARREALTSVVLFDVTPEDLEARLEGRRDKEARADDSLEVQQERLKVYQEQTAPLISFYENQGLLSRVPGYGAIEEVQARLRENLSS